MGGGPALKCPASGVYGRWYKAWLVAARSVYYLLGCKAHSAWSPFGSSLRSVANKDRGAPYGSTGLMPVPVCAYAEAETFCLFFVMPCQCSFVFACFLRTKGNLH